MSEHNAHAAEPKASMSLVAKLLSTLVTLVALALAFAVYTWIEGRYHVTDNLPPERPDLHVIHEAKGLVGKSLDGRKEEELLRQVQRNPDTGIEEVNNAVKAYRKRISKLEGGSVESGSGSSNASATSSGVRLVTPAPDVSLLDGNRWKVVLPANLEFRTGISMMAGQSAQFSGWTGEVKLDPREVYTNPVTGSFMTTGVTMAIPEPWVMPDAYTGALLARVDGQPYADVSGRSTYSFVAKSGGEIVLSINCLVRERGFASGSFTGVIEIR